MTRKQVANKISGAAHTHFWKLVAGLALTAIITAAGVRAFSDKDHANHRDVEKLEIRVDNHDERIRTIEQAVPRMDANLQHVVRQVDRLVDSQ